ncbi:hypothetical protein HELRODRAFT_190664 [Helobdella robusta]|uniref:Programmed cell death protein 2 C-terminal domain-containing protein n=1 Tax=Helobdella robusta TaxID=6412 RepID=T1FS69_HELRO|nr:hypothetical protein HELRODRAFT_190664 [Helobdella robusta]ESO08927.1 hypothetical protein HELRODRAFT_190664 [Helobdella robusta]
MIRTLLGLCDPSSRYDESSSDYFINRLGGKPDWLDNSPEIKDIECDNCHGTSMLFICQLYCPMQGSVNHRVLYFFVCPREVCNKSCKSWAVIRCQTNKPEVPEVHTESVVKINSAFNEFDFDSMNWDAPADETATTTTMMTSDNFPLNSNANNVLNNVAAIKPTFGAHSRESQTTNKSTTPRNILSTDNNSSINIETGSTKVPSREEKTNEHQMNSVGEDMLRLSLQENLPISTMTDPETEKIIKSSVFKDYLIGDVGEPHPKEVSNFDKLVHERLMFKPMYIDVIEEMDDDDEDDEDLDDDDGGDGGSWKEGQGDNMRGCFEDKDLKNFNSGLGSKCTMDSSEDFKLYDMSDIQQEFFERVRKYPKQIIRYSYKGKPLYYNKPIKPDEIPKCECGCSREFEVQLLPTIINYLAVVCTEEKRTTPIFENVDFGSVYVYTCPRNCWSSEGMTYRREYVEIQVDRGLDEICRSSSDRPTRRGRYKF